MEKLIIVDNFYSQPWEMMGLATKSEFGKEPGFAYNFNFLRGKSHLTDEAIQKLTDLVGMINLSQIELKINYNGSFFIRDKDYRPIVSATNLYQYVGYLMLGNSAQNYAGSNLRFVTHKNTSFSRLRKESLPLLDLKTKLYHWSVTDIITYRFNRLVLFNADRFHVLDLNSNTLLNQLFLFNTSKNV